MKVFAKALAHRNRNTALRLAGNVVKRVRSFSRPEVLFRCSSYFCLHRPILLKTKALSPAIFLVSIAVFMPIKNVGADAQVRTLPNVLRGKSGLVKVQHDRSGTYIVLESANTKPFPGYHVVFIDHSGDYQLSYINEEELKKTYRRLGTIRRHRHPTLLDNGYKIVQPSPKEGDPYPVPEDRNIDKVVNFGGFMDFAYDGILVLMGRPQISYDDYHRGCYIVDARSIQDLQFEDIDFICAPPAMIFRSNLSNQAFLLLKVAMNDYILSWAPDIKIVLPPGYSKKLNDVISIVDSRDLISVFLDFSQSGLLPIGHTDISWFNNERYSTVKDSAAGMTVFRFERGPHKAFVNALWKVIMNN